MENANKTYRYIFVHWITELMEVMLPEVEGIVLKAVGFCLSRQSRLAYTDDKIHACLQDLRVCMRSLNTKAKLCFFIIM